MHEKIPAHNMRPSLHNVNANIEPLDEERKSVDPAT